LLASRFTLGTVAHAVATGRRCKSGGRPSGPRRARLRPSARERRVLMLPRRRAGMSAVFRATWLTCLIAYTTAERVKDCFDRSADPRRPVERRLVPVVISIFGESTLFAARAGAFRRAGSPTALRAARAMDRGLAAGFVRSNRGVHRFSKSAAHSAWTRPAAGDWHSCALHAAVFCRNLTHAPGEGLGFWGWLRRSANGDLRSPGCLRAWLRWGYWRRVHWRIVLRPR